MIKKNRLKSSKNLIDQIKCFELQYEPEKHPRPYYLSSIKPPDVKITVNDLIGLFLTLCVNISLHFIVDNVTNNNFFELKFPDNKMLHESDYLMAISNYLKNQFFIDLYPPFAKLIFSLVSFLSGYKLDNFECFSENYPENFPFMMLKSITMFQNFLTIIFTFSIFKLLQFDTLMSLCFTCLFAFDYANIIISQMISGDSMLLASLSFIILLNLKIDQLEIFSKKWFKFMYLLGLSLGICCSIKYTGFSTLIYIILLQLRKSWFIIGDMTIKHKQPKYLIKFLTSVIFFLLLIPFTIFFSINIINLRLLSKTNSTGDDQGYSLMSSTFQANLLGNDFGVNNSNIPLNVLYGSKVSIRHYESLGGYLHSHNEYYPSGSKEQQVTLYNYKDSNNQWIIEQKIQMSESDLLNKKKYVAENQIIRLKHAETGKYLHVNDLRGPVSEQEYHFEVSCKGGYDDYKGEQADNWIINYDLDYSGKIDNDPGDNIIHPIGTVFKLYNRVHKCHLLSHDITLPNWGSFQQEVVCVKDASKTKSLFYIEENDHPLVNNKEKVIIHKLNALEKFSEFFVAIWKFATNRKNHGLITSRETLPEDWLLSNNKLQVFSNPNLKPFFTNLRLQSFGLSFMLSFGLFKLVNFLINMKWFGNFIFDSNKINLNNQEYSQLEKKLSYFQYQHFIFDLIVGFLIHYFSFYLVNEKFESINFLPTYYFLILINGTSLGFLWKYLKIPREILPLIIAWILQYNLQF